MLLKLEDDYVVNNNSLSNFWYRLNYWQTCIKWSIKSMRTMLIIRETWTSRCSWSFALTSPYSLTSSIKLMCTAYSWTWLSRSLSPLSLMRLEDQCSLNLRISRMEQCNHPQCQAAIAQKGKAKAKTTRIWSKCMWLINTYSLKVLLYVLCILIPLITILFCLKSRKQ
jgi:hypothetical protein